jgi:hypothetical protein
LQNKKQLFDYLIQQNLVKSYDIVQHLSEQAPLLDPSLSKRITQTHNPYVLVSTADTLRATYYRQISSLSQPHKDLIKQYAQHLTGYMNDDYRTHIRIFEPEANDIITARDEQHRTHQPSLDMTSDETNKVTYPKFDEV